MKEFTVTLRPDPYIEDYLIRHLESMTQAERDEFVLQSVIFAMSRICIDPTPPEGWEEDQQ